MEINTWLIENQDQRYEMNKPNVIGEVFDGDWIAVNLELGNYFSLNVDAHKVLKLLTSGHSIAEVIRKLESLNLTSTMSQIPAFHSFLIENKIIRELKGEQSGNELDLLLSDGLEGKIEFRVYTDLQDILLLDPVHDVDDKGWPITKEIDY